VAKQRTGTKPDEILRARAKKFLARPGPELDKITLNEIRKLVEELQINQVELDMQNEELRRSHAETEAALVRYADLYDSDPIGYFTFDPQGLILEMNLTGVRLLGGNGAPSCARRSFPTSSRHAGLRLGITCSRFLAPRRENSASCSWLPQTAPPR
jgi:PAS domain-containing protein